jgi:hypothetical protein
VGRRHRDTGALLSRDHEPTSVIGADITTPELRRRHGPDPIALDRVGKAGPPQSGSGGAGELRPSGIESPDDLPATAYCKIPDPAVHRPRHTQGRYQRSQCRSEAVLPNSCPGSRTTAVIGIRPRGIHNRSAP